MKNPSIKNVSTAEIEAAIAKALAELTGWKDCTVKIRGMEFAPEQLTSREDVQFTLKAVFAPPAWDPKTTNF